MTRTTHLFASALAVAATVATLVVPAALAAGTYPDAFERALNAAAPTLDQSSYPDVFERAVAAHRASSTTVASPGRATPDVPGLSSAPIAGSGDGFDWTSAGIGGSAALVVLLVGGGALVTRHSRGRVAVR